jgi:hypothetical protein
MRSPEQEHEGTRVDDAQGSVDFDRLAIALDFESLAEDHLKDIASLDVLATLQNRSLKSTLREIGLGR